MNDKLDPKNYAKYDRTFMAFGSIMNGLQGYIADKDGKEISKTIQLAWSLSKTLVSEFVDELYKKTQDDDFTKPM